MKIIQSLNQSSSIDMENFLSTSKQIQSLDMIKDSKIRNSHSFDFRKMIILIIIMLIITVIYLILIYTIITNEFNDYFADTQQQNYLEKEMKIKKRKEEKRKKKRQKRKEKKRKLKAEKKAKKRKEKLKQKLMEFRNAFRAKSLRTQQFHNSIAPCNETVKVPGEPSKLWIEGFLDHISKTPSSETTDDDDNDDDDDDDNDDDDDDNSESTKETESSESENDKRRTKTKTRNTTKTQKEFSINILKVLKEFIVNQQQQKQQQYQQQQQQQNTFQAIKNQDFLTTNQKLPEDFGYQTSTVFKGNTEVLKILEKEIHLPDQRTLSSALGITTKPKPIKKQRPPYWQSPTAALSTSPYKQQQPPPPPYWQTPNTALSTSPFEQQQPPQYWQSPTASFLSPPFKQQQPQYWQSPPFKQQYYQEKKQLIKPQKIIINFVPYNSTSTNEISENSDSDQQSQHYHHHHQPQRKSIQNSSNLRISSEHGIATRIGEAVAEAMRINMKVLDDIYPYHKGGDKRNKQ